MALGRSSDVDDATFDQMIKDMVTIIKVNWQILYKEYKLTYVTPVYNVDTQSQGVVQDVYAKSKSKFMSMLQKDGGSTSFQSSRKLRKYIDEVSETMINGFHILQRRKVNAPMYLMNSKLARK